MDLRTKPAEWDGWGSLGAPGFAALGVGATTVEPIERRDEDGRPLHATNYLAMLAGDVDWIARAHHSQPYSRTDEVPVLGLAVMLTTSTY